MRKNRVFSGKKRSRDDADLEMVVKDRSRNYINEAFRMMRTTLDFMADSNKGSQVIMVTSFNPGSGKTFISMNLAQSLALKGKRVILLDVDLRRASISKKASAGAQGISSYLVGKVDNVNDLIMQHGMGKGVDFMPVGAIPPNPVELLLTDKYATLINKLRQEYDYIVLDCSPYDLVADTSILARVADLSIFVIRAGLFDKSMLADLEDIYNRNKLPNLSIVFNGVDPRRSYYTKRYGYHSYSGYYGKEDADN